MKTVHITIAIIAAAMLMTLSPANAKADESDKKTVVTFSQPVEIPGMVLPAGTYVFRRISNIDPHVVQISNADETQVYATRLTIPDYRMDPADTTLIAFEERPNGSPQGIKSWFYPGETTGEEFVYTSSSRTKDQIEAMKDEIEAIQAQMADMRNAQAHQAERIDAVGHRAQEGLAEANKEAMAATTASQIAAAADRIAADADRRAEAAQFNARRSVNQIHTVAEEIEDRIANLDKYKMADQTTVTFNFNSDELRKEDMSKLDNVARSVSGAHSGCLIELQGFTDKIGTEKYNLGLSDRRVESVLRYLVSKGVPLYRISLVGLGEADPVADNQTAAGREQNRRVEIQVLRSLDTEATAAR